MTDGVDPRVVKLRDDASGWGKVGGPTLTPEEPFLTGLSEDEATAWVRGNWALEHSTPEAVAEFRAAADEDDDSADAGDADEGGDGDSTDDADAEAEGETEAFDADAFVDDAWQSIVSDIENGDVDAHLDAVEDAEEARDSPRDSVLNAIEERRD